MATVKQSFLSNIIGRETYNKIKSHAKTIIVPGSCILAIILSFSLYFHWGFISNLLNLVTGTSLLCVAYIVALVVKLDIEVDVDEPEDYYWSKTEKKPKPIKYKFTIVWGSILIIFGICAIYFSSQYRKHYAFECETFLVDHQLEIYHLDCGSDCKAAARNEDLEEMQGYQIDDSYTFCDFCREWSEEMEEEYNSNRYR
jgi:hypothetical protein